MIDYLMYKTGSTIRYLDDNDWRKKIVFSKLNWHKYNEGQRAKAIKEADDMKKNKKTSSITPWGNRRRLSINGTKTVLMVRVNAADVDNSHTEEELSDAVFGTNGRQVSLQSQYSDCSHGKLNFEPAIGDGISNGKFGILA